MPAVERMRRVVITGAGIVSPLGSTKEALWEALSQGASGVAPLESLPGAELPMPFAAEARGFTGDVADFGPLDGDLKKAVRKGLKLMCRESQMGVAAAFHALTDAGLAAGKYDPLRTGIVYGSDYMLSEPSDFAAGIATCAENGRFQYERWGGEGMRQLTPLWLLKYLPNMPACHIAIYRDLQGPNNSLTVREASANLAVAEAYRTIARGSADIMLAGSTGTRIHAMRTIHVVQQEEMAAGDAVPAEASRPFDRDRTGMVLGEGAGAVVLEELASAQARGATIYGEVVGTGSSSAADRDFRARRDVALANVVRMALRQAGITPAELGHVHAHGLGTRSGDVDEWRALEAGLGERARTVPVVAAKANFGNLGAGGGAVELVASLMALRAGRLFPLLNYRHPDPACPIHAVTEPEVSPGESFLNLSVTPQGQAAGVLVRRLER